MNAFLATLGRTDKAEGTKGMYRQKCGVLVRHIGADTALSDVTAKRVDQFIEDREQEAVAFDDRGRPTRFVTANTIHKELVALRQVLKHARRRGEFRRALEEVLPVGFSPQYEPRKVSLTMEQAAALCAALPLHRAAAVAFFMATGARKKEMEHTRREDVNLETGLVHLRGTKTEGAERTITVPAFARSLLKLAVEHGRGKDGLLLLPWGNMLRALRRACARIGAPQVNRNDLRRTLSTWLIEGGVTDYVVSKVLGHKTPTMVHKVYGKPRTDAVGELLARQSAEIAPVRVVYVLPSNPKGE